MIRLRYICIRKLDSYDVEKIYNWDETGLYYKLFLVILAQHKRNQDEFVELKHRKQKIESH